MKSEKDCAVWVDEKFDFIMRTGRGVHGCGFQNHMDITSYILL